MRLRQLVEFIRRKSRLIAASAALGALGALVAGLLMTPSYEATSQVVVAFQEVRAAVGGAGFVEFPMPRPLMPASLVALVKDPPSEEASTPPATDRARPQDVTVAVQQDAPAGEDKSTIVRITVADPDPERAASLANAAAERFVADLEARWFRQLEAARREVVARADAAEARLKVLRADTTSSRTVEAEAQAEAENLVLLRSRLEQIDVMSRLDGVAIRVLDRATAPGAPVSPRPVPYTMLGLIAGLVLGVVAGALQEGMDQTVKSADEAGDIAPVLAVLPVSTIDWERHEPGGSQQRAATALAPIRAAFEHLRESEDVASLFIVTASARRDPARVALALEESFGSTGQRAVVVSGDEGLVAAATRESAAAVGGLRPVPVTGRSDDAPLDSASMRRALGVLAQGGDYVIAVARACELEQVATFSRVAGRVVILTEERETSREDLGRLAAAIELAGGVLLGQVFLTTTAQPECPRP